jgi:cell division protein FtsX
MTGPPRPGIGKGRTSPTVRARHHRFGPIRYIWRQVWGERGRNLLTFLSLAIMSTVLTLFLAANEGLDDHFSDDIGVPSDENKELFEVREVISGWSSFMLFLCASLMALSTANASSMDILERRFELSTLRAIGTRFHQVIMLLISPLVLVMISGLVMGPIIVFASLSIMGDDPRLPLGPDLGVPLSFSLGTFLFVMAVGTLAAAFGAAPSLVSVLTRSQLEVLRDAP